MYTYKWGTHYESVRHLSVCLSICPHIYSLQLPNESELHLEEWLSRIQSPCRFHPKTSLPNLFTSTNDFITVVGSNTAFFLLSTLLFYEYILRMYDAHQPLVHIASYLIIASSNNFGNGYFIFWLDLWTKKLEAPSTFGLKVASGVDYSSLKFGATQVFRKGGTPSFRYLLTNKAPLTKMKPFPFFLSFPLFLCP